MDIKVKITSWTILKIILLRQTIFFSTEKKAVDVSMLYNHIRHIKSGTLSNSNNIIDDLLVSDSVKFDRENFLFGDEQYSTFFLLMR